MRTSIAIVTSGLLAAVMLGDAEAQTYQVPANAPANIKRSVESAARPAEQRAPRKTTVDPEDVSVLEPTSSAVLTLVTCYPFNFVGNAPQRFIVRADLISERPRG